MTFYVGQKVICVNDTNYWSAEPIIKGVDGKLHHMGSDMGGLEKGTIYTVSGHSTSLVDGESTIFLAEIKRVGGLPDDGFWARRFRPVVERKTDISIFTAMLTPKKAKVEA